MAQRRMFTMQIVDSDAFLDMPLSAQALYFHLNMRADDDGFINNPRKIQRMINASDDDFRLLITKRFVLVFESGVIVIKHWRMHNYIGKNRYHPTQYQQELAQLGIKDNGAYTEAGNMLPEDVSPGFDERRNNGETMENKCPAEVSIGKDSLGKVSLGKKKAPAPKKKYGAFGWVKLTEAEYDRLTADLGAEELARCIQYVDESAQKTSNKNGWTDWNLVIRNCSRDGWGLRGKQQQVKKEFHHDPANLQKFFDDYEAGRI